MKLYFETRMGLEGTIELYNSLLHRDASYLNKFVDGQAKRYNLYPSTFRDIARAHRALNSNN